jgi:biotin carboxylase
MIQPVVTPIVSVVIPSRNGAATLPSLCRAVFKSLDDLGQGAQIIVVLDGSEDPSSSLLTPLLKEGVIDRVIEFAFPAGQQVSTITGILQSHGELIITMDDDFGHSPDALGVMLERMGERVDLLFALPDIGRGAVARSLLRRMAGWLRDALFRAAICGGGRGDDGVREAGPPKKLVPSSFRLFRRRAALPLARQIAAGDGCCYLSVSLAAAARQRESLLLPRTGKGYSSPEQERYRLTSLIRLFSRLLLATLPMPKAIRRCFCKLRFPEMQIRLACRRILLVGGGMGQMGLARRAKELGLELLVSDRDTEAPARILADGFLRADTFDPEESVKALRVHLQALPDHSRRRGRTIHGVMTGGTDQPVLTVAAVARDFKLPGALTFETALSVTNKEVMKKRFAEAGLPALPWKIVSAGDAGDAGATSKGAFRDINYPAVIKPVDSQGQRGIFLVQTPERAAERLPETLKWSRAGRAVLEPFYPGFEVTFSGWVCEGHLYPLLLTDRTTMSEGEHIGICPAHRYPCSLPEAQRREVVQLCRQLVRGFGIVEGPLYVQLLSGEQGLVINEVACRIGGAYEEVLIPALTGVDILNLQIDTSLYGRPGCGALGGLRRAESSWPPKGFASVILAFTGPGEVRETGPDRELEVLSGVVDGGYLIKPGKQIGAMENSTGRAAWGVVLADSPEELNRRVELFYGALRVTGRDGKSMVRDLRNFAKHRLLRQLRG